MESRNLLNILISQFIVFGMKWNIYVHTCTGLRLTTKLLTFSRRHWMRSLSFVIAIHSIHRMLWQMVNIICSNKIWQPILELPLSYFVSVSDFLTACIKFLLDVANFMEHSLQILCCKFGITGNHVMVCLAQACTHVLYCSPYILHFIDVPASVYPIVDPRLRL